jgi:tRNA dimethylallyltransferase
MTPQPPILAIVGATASGKGALAQEIADATGASLVSVDSRKVYRGLDIGTAKPSPEVQKKYRLAMIDRVNPDQTFSAGEYVRQARAIVGERVARGERVILVGGTGFYLDAFINGLSELPAIDPEIRQAVLSKAETEGWEAVHSEIARADPAGADSIALTDKTRLLRAAEVFRQTGRPIGAWQRELSPDPAPWKVLVYEVLRPRTELRERIERRVVRMIEEGLIEETQAMADKGYGEGCPGMSGVGYLEVMSFLKGRIGRRKMIEEIAAHTRQYAKRQLTWFRHRSYVQRLDFQPNVRQLLTDGWLD